MGDGALQVQNHVTVSSHQRTSRERERERKKTDLFAFVRY